MISPPPPPPPPPPAVLPFIYYFFSSLFLLQSQRVHLVRHASHTHKTGKKRAFCLLSLAVSLAKPISTQREGAS